MHICIYVYMYIVVVVIGYPNREDGRERKFWCTRFSTTFTIDFNLHKGVIA